MTGPEHYQEAERLLRAISPDPKYHAGNEALTAVAQVHATLALAAATALGHIDAALGGMDEDAWIQAASVYTRGETP